MRINSIQNINYNIAPSNHIKKTAKQNNCLQYKNSLECLAIYNQIAFLGKKSIPIYAMDYYGNLQKFSSISHMSETLGVTQATLGCLTGEGHHSAKGYTFMLASDLEFPKEDGTYEIDKEKLKELSRLFSKSKNAPIYHIDIYGKITRYENSNEAKNELNLERIYTHGTRNSSCSHYFISANEIEIRDENAKIVFDENKKPKIDYSKLANFVEKMPSTNSYPICLIDKKGKVTFVNSLNEASKITGISLGSLYKCLNGQRAFVKEYIVLKTKDIAKRDENYRAIVDENGITETDKKVFEDTMLRFNYSSKTIVKLTNPHTGESLEFEGTQAAANYLGVSRQAISGAFKRNSLCKGYKISY